MLKEFSSYVVYSVLKLEQGSRLGDAIEFFIYDTIKIFLLLRKVLKIQLLAVFVGIMTVTIIAVGYMFNAIL